MFVRKTLIFLLTTFITVKVEAQSTNSCKILVLPSIHFIEKKLMLSSKNKLILDSVAKLAKFYPKCKIRVSNYSRILNEGDSQISWDKMTLVIVYLNKRGINRENLIYNYADDGDYRKVNLTFTTEAGLLFIPKPMPCFSIFTKKITPPTSQSL